MLNKSILEGRLTADPEIFIREEEGQEIIWGRYRLAVERDYKKGSGQNVDFINCVVTGPRAKFAGKYLKKATGITIEGRLQTGNYINDQGQKVYTMEVFVIKHYFPVGNKMRGGENAEPSSAVEEADQDQFMFD